MGCDIHEAGRLCDAVAAAGFNHNTGLTVANKLAWDGRLVRTRDHKGSYYRLAGL